MSTSASVNPSQLEVPLASLQTRVINIIKEPAREWPVIAAEADSVGRLYREYIIPLSAIGPIASLIGLTLLSSVLSLGIGAFAGLGMGVGLVFIVVSWVVGLAAVYLDAVIIEWLAPKFKSSGTRVDALKIVAYSMTPMWVASVLNLVPLLGILVLLAGLYGIYVCYLGLPHVMKTPADQVVIFMLVSFVVIVIVQFIIATILGAIFLSGALMTAAAVG